MEELLDIEELKREAEDLGISFSTNIGAAKLQERIDAHYKSQETSGNEIEEAVKQNEKSEEKSVEKGKNTEDAEVKKRQRIAAEKKAASKISIITITDNDQRVNNQTTTAIVNCSNMYFDLGTAVLPLNVPVEVKQGHINVLKAVKIPHHVKDNKTGLSTARMVPRYAISYEANQPK